MAEMDKRIEHLVSKLLEMKSEDLDRLEAVLASGALLPGGDDDEGDTGKGQVGTVELPERPADRFFADQGAETGEPFTTGGLFGGPSAPGPKYFSSLGENVDAASLIPEEEALDGSPKGADAERGVLDEGPAKELMDGSLDGLASLEASYNDFLSSMLVSEEAAESSKLLLQKHEEKRVQQSEKVSEATSEPLLFAPVSLIGEDDEVGKGRERGFVPAGSEASLDGLLPEAPLESPEDSPEAAALREMFDALEPGLASEEDASAEGLGLDGEASLEKRGQRRPMEKGSTEPFVPTVSGRRVVMQEDAASPQLGPATATASTGPTEREANPLSFDEIQGSSEGVLTYSFHEHNGPSPLSPSSEQLARMKGNVEDGLMPIDGGLIPMEPEARVRTQKPSRATPPPSSYVSENPYNRATSSGFGFGYPAGGGQPQHPGTPSQAGQSPGPGPSEVGRRPDGEPPGSGHFSTHGSAMSSVPSGALGPQMTGSFPVIHHTGMYQIVDGVPQPIYTASFPPPMASGQWTAQGPVAQAPSSVSSRLFFMLLGAALSVFVLLGLIWIGWFYDPHRGFRHVSARPQPPKVEVTPFLAARVQIRSSPSGAMIFLDGAGTGLKTPASLRLRPGKYVLTLRLKGFRESRKELVVRKVRHLTWFFDLYKLPPPKVKRATLYVTASAYRARIWIDRKLTHYKTPAFLSLPPGKHLLQVEKRGYRSWRRSIFLKDGEYKHVYLRIRYPRKQRKVSRRKPPKARTKAKVKPRVKPPPNRRPPVFRASRRKPPLSRRRVIPPTRRKTMP